MKRLAILLSAILAVGASFAIGWTISPDSEPEEYTGPTEIQEATFNEVMAELMENHYSQPDKETLIEGAINGMITALDDPHSSYFDYEEAVEFTNSFSETYTGIGVTVRYTDGLIVVEQVKKDGPADGAGILPNDIIAFVDGKDVRTDEYYEIISTILGDEGTDVTIGVIRQGVDTVINLTMTRAVIQNSTVEYTSYDSEGKTIGYIEVSTFGDETADKFADAIEELEKLNIDGLIVDLRNNGGGHLSTVYYMMNEILLDNGNEMFSTQYYSNGEFKIQEYHATNKVKKDYNIVTLVNQNSASASEVFSSGMQEQGDYPVIGVQTYGKGTMQTDASLLTTEGDALHISIGKWITADGNWVHFNGGTDGVTPDVIIEPTVYETAYKLFLFDDETLEFDTVDTRVQNLQYILIGMGYEVREDGYFDVDTQNAIKDIQTTNGLTPTGVVDSQVLVFINEALDTYQNNYLNDTQLLESIEYLVDNPLND